VKRIIVGLLLATVWAAGPAAAAEAVAPPGLSVSIRSGSSEVRAGDRLEYTATVRNSGTSPVDGRLLITVPAYLRVASAAGATRSGLDTSWIVTVPAGGSVKKKLVGVLDDIPKGELRVTTLVGLYIGDATQPAIRSAEADTIAGITDPAHAINDPTTAPSASDSLPIGWIVVGIGVLGLLAAVCAWWILRRRQLSSSRR
jgi:hypothetical protein